MENMVGLIHRTDRLVPLKSAECNGKILAWCGTMVSFDFASIDNDKVTCKSCLKSIKRESELKCKTMK